MNSDLASRLALMRDLSLAARAVTLPLHHAGAEATDKNSADVAAMDPVTEADTEAERIMRDIIGDHFPSDAVTGEEFPDREGTSGYTWTLDPIDGTRGFVAGVPVWSTLIAVSAEDRPTLGLIDHPALGRRYWGMPGRAWREDDAISGNRGTETPLSTRACPELRHAILGCTAPFGMFTPGELAAYRTIGSGVAFQRLGLDALGHALVASGRMDIIVEAGMKPCDIAALVPVVEGAGGSVTDWSGRPAREGRVLTLGDRALLPELLDYLGRALS